MIQAEFFLKQGEPISISAIRQFEINNNIFFPEDYKSFLSIYGRVYLKDCCLDGYFVAFIGDLNYIEGASSFIDEWQEDWQGNKVTDNFLPLGECETIGVYYCFQKDTMKIYRICLNEFPENFITPLADTFTEFINKLAYRDLGAY